MLSDQQHSVAFHLIRLAGLLALGANSEKRLNLSDIELIVRYCQIFSDIEIAF